jgi:hypothetical protein
MIQIVKDRCKQKLTASLVLSLNQKKRVISALRYLTSQAKLEQQKI